MEPYHVGKTCEEFEEYKNADKCRYCMNKILGKPVSDLPAFAKVCQSPECAILMSQSCDKILECGHACCGFAGEEKCLPCLNEECVEKDSHATLGKTIEDYCIICYI